MWQPVAKGREARTALERFPTAQFRDALQEPRRHRLAAPCHAVLFTFSDGLIYSPLELLADGVVFRRNGVAEEERGSELQAVGHDFSGQRRQSCPEELLLSP